MMKIRSVKWWLMLLGCCALLSAPAQYGDLHFQKEQTRFEIPFEYHNNFIVVEVKFNNIFPLKFIFDTGAEHTVLTKREITDLLNISYDKVFSIMGADMKTVLYAYLARGISMRFEEFTATNRTILVLDEDYFQFDKFGGIEIHGIMGADIFRRFIVKINYARKVITLINPEYWSPPKRKYLEYDLEIHRSKPYLYADATLANDTTLRTKFLMDTGAGLSLLLYTNTDSMLTVPEKVIPSNIGMGLGGYLEGYLGRIKTLDLGAVRINEPITNFQELPMELLDTTYLNDRNGIIGNEFLSRFTVILDYIHGKAYFAPMQGFDRKFKYDRSGLVVSASGPNLNQFTVFYIVPESPAEEAGLQKGDELKWINGVPALLFTLDGINKKFRKRIGKKIRLVVERDEERLKFIFRLQELI